MEAIGDGRDQNPGIMFVIKWNLSETDIIKRNKSCISLENNIMEEWERESALGVIEQIKKSINDNNRLLECWKQYLKSLDKNSLENMKTLDKEFMYNILAAL